MNGVQGVALLSVDGKVLYASFEDDTFISQKNTENWKMIMDSVDDFKELDLVFEKGRVYMRKTEEGYLVVSMTMDVSIAMVKLNCDIVIPELNKAQNSPKGLKRFFKFS